MKTCIQVVFLFVFLSMACEGADSSQDQLLQSAMEKLAAVEKFEVPQGYVYRFDSTTVKTPREKTLTHGLIISRNGQFLLMTIRKYDQGSNAEVAMTLKDGFYRLTRDYRRNEKTPVLSTLVSTRPFTVASSEPGKKWTPTVAQFAYGFAALPESDRSLYDHYKVWLSNGGKYDCSKAGKLNTYVLHQWPADYLEDSKVTLVIDDDAIVRDIAYTLKGGTKSAFHLGKTTPYDGLELPTELTSSAKLNLKGKTYDSQTKTVATFEKDKLEFPDEAFKLEFWGAKPTANAPVARVPNNNWLLIACGVVGIAMVPFVVRWYRSR